MNSLGSLLLKRKNILFKNEYMDVVAKMHHPINSQPHQTKYFMVEIRAAIQAMVKIQEG